MIAAAVAASMVAPAAMADTTLGGQIQAEVVSVTGDGVNEGLYLTDGWEGAKDNAGGASALFVKGAHDLGNGLKGVYKLNLNPLVGRSSAGDAVGVRDVYIGLSGGFGTVLFGKLNTPYKSSTVKWDPFLGSFMQARGNNGMTAAGHNGYADNVVAYANKFGPATVVAAVAFDESDDNPAGDGEIDGDHAVTASVNVPVGPVEVALAYIDTAGWKTFKDDINNVEAIKAGVKFNAGGFNIAGQYETVDAGGNALLDNALLTGSFKAGSNTFSASYGVAMPDTGDDGTYWAVGVKHSFSKTVSMLLGATASDNADFSDATDDEVTRVGLSTRVKF
jgi:hypothetical protein